MKLLLITPPFTQLNTPYPATAYLKGFLNTQKINSVQSDLGIEVILRLFTKQGLQKLFAKVKVNKLSPNASRIFQLQNEYIKTIDQVILFLQEKNQALAQLIAERNYLPEASRFNQLDDLDWAFGTMGVKDKAKHLATLYLEDLSDLIVEAIDPHFGFSRYAERLGRSAASFDELHRELQKKNTFIDDILIEILQEKVEKENPQLICFSVPFPGNLYSAFKSAQWIKKNYPHIKLAMGGGFPNTELRSLKDKRVFEYFDFITLDDGERPILNLVEFLQNKRKLEELKRTFVLQKGEVSFVDGAKEKDFSHAETGTPDYSDLLLDRYISVIEIANPMHRLWSDGRWNKLTLAHGCYWGKCTFCDITLDYIKNYEPSAAKLIVDRIEELIAQTNNNGFHFVDEAAPPALMRDVALEIIRRNLTVVWWTNIRFEKSFTKDLCLLLAASGCIAVSGGLEVASERLLSLINKGVTLPQVANVTHNFTQAGIMVHAYLMYGFPTQTAQETIDALEVVRQLFESGIVQSAYWHQFAMTAHSPVGLNPQQFKVETATKKLGTFANNDMICVDKIGAEHEKFSEGLKKSLFNYMHGICFDYELQEWFDFKVPKTKMPSNFVSNAILQGENFKLKGNTRVVWMGNALQFKSTTKKGKVEVLISSKREEISFVCSQKMAQQILDFTTRINISNSKVFQFSELQSEFTDIFGSAEIYILKENGLLYL